MHNVIEYLLFWSFIGGMIPICIVGPALFTPGKLPAWKRVAFAIACGPSAWTLLAFAGIVGTIMAIRHRMRAGKPIAAPPAPAARA